MAKVGTDKAPAYVYMIASPGEEEEYVKGIEDVVGCVPVLEVVQQMILYLEIGKYLRMINAFLMELLLHFSTQINQ